MSNQNKVVYALIGENVHFFEELRFLNAFLSVMYQNLKLNFTEIEDDSFRSMIEYGSTFGICILDNGENYLEVRRFEFEPDTEIAFCQTSGPSGECCAFTDTNSFKFYKEMSSYMSRSFEICPRDGDRIGHETKHSTKSLLEMKYTVEHYYYVDGDSGKQDDEIMDFKLYHGF